MYYATLAALVVLGTKGTYDDMSWPRLARGMLLVVVCCWFVPNSFSYSIAHLQGWQHGRFAPVPEQTLPAMETTAAKVGVGLLIGSLTMIGGSIWLLGCSTLLVWLPGHKRRRRAARTA